jgi:UDP-N-acetylenolpyruvoylglucosamine reductase
MLGVCGAGMAPLAIYLAQRGNAVYGWDDYVNLKTKDLLTANGVVFLPEKFLPPCDCVVRSSAVNELKDSVCIEATGCGIEIFRRGEYLAKVCAGKKLFAIVGSHGKTSVSGNCVEILRRNGTTFDYIIGGFFKGNVIAPASCSAESEWIVAEIDESDGTMNAFSPECTVALNYDDDHIGNYGTRENFIDAFRNLLRRTKAAIFVPENDEIFSALAGEFREKYVKIGDLSGDDFIERNRKTALVCLEKAFGQSFQLPDEFCGIQRRNDVMLRINGITFLNDYAHHPAELQSLLRFARKHYCDHELTIIFQPHRLSRTRQYFAEFAQILDKFDRPFVVELYRAFEDEISGVSSDLVFNSMNVERRGFIKLAEFSERVHAICGDLRSSDRKQLVMFVGAGSILSHCKKFVTEIAFAEAEKRLAQAEVPFSSFANLTNFFSVRVATAARICANPRSSDELATILLICKKLNINCLPIGNGTKILPCDGLMDAICVKMNGWCSIQWIDSNTIRCSSGVALRDLCDAVAGRGYSGIEKLIGIPCSVGGAIRMNAGAHGQEIADQLLSIDILDRNAFYASIGKDDLKFTYRFMGIPIGSVILSATFRFSEKAPAKCFRQTRDDLLEWRKAHQPRGMNFGSVFKNGTDFRAGELIDRAGLKGISVGDARISEEHGNFIISGGNARAIDIEKLIDRARYEVFTKFGKFMYNEVNFIRL